MRFRLRYLQHNLELPPGQFVIGRSTDCQLSLDDPLVSRRHARLIVGHDAVFVEDLGSRNGVLVDGRRIDKRRKLEFGQTVTVGSQDMVLLDGDGGVVARDPHATQFNGPRLSATATIASYNAADVEKAFSGRSTMRRDDDITEEVSKKADAFRLLGGVADKALALGRAEEAERILQSLLEQVLQWAREGREILPDVADQAGRYAARLGGATGKGIWVDYVFELFGRQHRVLPAAIVDELYSVLRKVDTVDRTALREYVAQLRESSGVYGPAERFLLQRIEGLERLAALK